MITELKYTGESVGKYCSICKLTFIEVDIINACPNCQALFHEHHLLEWLTIKSKCPVCGYDLTEIIEKYKIRETQIEVDESKNKNDKSIQELTFINPNQNSKPKITLMFSLVIGIILGFGPTIPLAIFATLPVMIIGLAISYLLFITGLGIIVRGFTVTKKTIANFWHILTFTEEKISVEKLDTTSVDIFHDEIVHFYIYPYNFMSDEIPISYEIRFEMLLQKNKRFNFNIIYDSKSYKQRDKTFSQLSTIISKNFKNEKFMFESNKFIVDFLKSKTLIYSTLGYLLFCSILSVLSYYVF